MAKRILIVDDEERIRQVLRLTLEAAGYEVGEAADGPRGLEEFGDGSSWDAVLLDQKMPGMDGLETLRRMKQRTPGARVIMVTAYASIELAVNAMKLGATDFVRKPMTPEILRNAVTAALAKPSASFALPPGPPAGKAAEPLPPLVSRLTLNGFQFWADPHAEERLRREPRERRFVVQFPDGRRQDVVAEIALEAVDFVERATQRRLSWESGYWDSVAERCLNAYLWDEGRVPPGGKFTILAKEIDRDRLQLAAQWEE